MAAGPICRYAEPGGGRCGYRAPAIFLTRDLTQVPVALLHALKHYKALHERVVMMQVETEDVPHVAPERRLEIHEVGKGFHTMLVRYGFMDEPNVMRALAQCRIQHFPRQSDGDLVLHRPRRKLRPRPAPAQPSGDCANRLFIFLSNLALDATEFLPHPAQPCRRARRASRNLRLFPRPSPRKGPCRDASVSPPSGLRFVGREAGLVGNLRPP